MKKYTYPLIWILIGIVISILDYYDHISRENQVFKDYKLPWFLYTFLSLAVLTIVTLLSNIIISKIVKSKFLTEITSFLIGIILFQRCGKLINEITIPQIKLEFKFNLMSYIIPLIVYGILHIIINFLLKKIYGRSNNSDK